MPTAAEPVAYQAAHDRLTLDKAHNRHHWQPLIVTACEL